MANFLVDENMPRSTVRVLETAGHVAQHVRDARLSGQPDRDIFNYAQAIGAAIVTRDMGFASTLDYPLGTHAGVIVLRIPNEVTTSQLNTSLLKALAMLEDQDITGSLVIVEPSRTRIRRGG